MALSNGPATYYQGLNELCDRFPDFEKRLRQVQILLNSSEISERVRGVRILANCGEDNTDLAESIFSILLELLRDTEPEVQESAEYGFDQLGRLSFDHLLKLLRDGYATDTHFLAQLIRALGHFHYQKTTSNWWPSANRQIASFLDHPSTLVRGAAALTMSEFGETSHEFIDQLKLMCRSGDSDERRFGLRALKQATENSPKLAAPLREFFFAALGERDPDARLAVEYALSEGGSAIFAQLFKRLQDEDSQVRAHALNVFTRSYRDDLGRAEKHQAAKRICELLLDPEKDVRSAAAFAAREYFCSDESSSPHENFAFRIVQGIKDFLSPDNKIADTREKHLVIERLIAMCSAPDADERSAALHSLWSIGQQQGEEQFSVGLEAISENLQHEDDDVRKWAYDAYRYFKQESNQVVSVLIRGVDDPSCDVAGTATKALKDLASEGMDVSSAIPALCRVLDRRDCDKMQAVYLPFEPACEILTMFPPESVKCAIEPLEKSLSSNSSKVVGAAAVALWKIAGRVEASLPRLKALFDEGEMYPTSFCNVLYNIVPAAAPLTSEVVALLADPDWDTQWAAADALGEIASTDPICISAMIAALQYASGIVRGAAVRGLSKIGKAAVPQLIRSLREGDDELKEMAADALGVIGNDAREAVDDLTQLLQSSEEGVRDWSAIALGKIVGSDKAMPALVTILRLREGANIRAQAIEALGCVGPNARSALPLIEAAMNDDDENVRSAAQAAILSISSR